MNRTKPILLSEDDVVLRGVQIKSNTYPLKKEELDLLLHCTSKWKSYSSKFAWAGIGILIKIAGACIAIAIAFHDNQINNIPTETRISAIDIYSILFCLFIAIVLFVISRFTKSPGEQLIDEIRTKIERKI